MPRLPHLVNCTTFSDAQVLALLDRPFDTAEDGTLFRALPRELWIRCFRATDGPACSCTACSHQIGPPALDYWDTLASATTERGLEVWTAHYPAVARPADSARD